MTKQYDLIIVGSGFGGSLLAMIARRAGLSVLLLEKGTHPRFAIGESTTPLSNLLLEEIADRFDLPQLKPLAKWGTWQQTYPNLTCGLKRGFSFYHHEPGAPGFDPADRERHLLVAASPNEASADTHWYRADFDLFLLSQAQAMGVDYRDRVSLSSLTELEDGVAADGFRGRFLVDATGPRGFVHRALGLAETAFPDYPATQALYTHFSEVRRVGAPDGPYPADDAALHHIFEGGWIWVLPFNNGLVSAGVATTDALATRLHLDEGSAAWGRLLDLLPAVKRQFANAQPQLPFMHARRLSFLSATITGKRWAMLPSAAAFIDPLLSTGFPLTLWGVARLGEIVTHDWNSNDWNSRNFAARLEAYARQTRNEALATARLIGALYATMGNFPLFTSLSFLYFAAASYSESARRLNKDHLASSFLLCDDPVFAPAFNRFCHRAHHVKTGDESLCLQDDIVRAIEPFNVAGLGRADRRNWFPVDPRDLIQSAGKLGAATEDSIRRLLTRSGFPAP